MSSKTVLITGSEGLIGWHLRCHLYPLADTEVVCCNHQQFGDANFLEDAVKRSDVVLHFAGVNRGSDSDVEFDNPKIAQQLVDALAKSKSQPHVVYSSSTHIDRDSPYGRGKRNAGLILHDWAHATKSRFSNLVLPHVFGEHGKPLYNSAVSTFAWQLAHNEPSEIHGNGLLSLMHTSEIAALVLSTLDEPQLGEIRPQGQEISVVDVYKRLERLARRYQSGVIPCLDDGFDLKLFNTFRSYLPQSAREIPFQLHSDNRGNLFETVRADGKGQVFLSSTHPGVTRGNHFHTRKVERFVVIQGQADIRLRKMFSNEVLTYSVCGDSPVAIDIPTLHTHNITNTGDDKLVTLFWAGEFFDPDDPDTFACDVGEVMPATQEAG